MQSGKKLPESTPISLAETLIGNFIEKLAAQKAEEKKQDQLWPGDCLQCSKEYLPGRDHGFQIGVSRQTGRPYISDKYFSARFGADGRLYMRNTPENAEPILLAPNEAIKEEGLLKQIYDYQMKLEKMNELIPNLEVTHIDIKSKPLVTYIEHLVSLKQSWELVVRGEFPKEIEAVYKEIDFKKRDAEILLAIRNLFKKKYGLHGNPVIQTKEIKNPFVREFCEILFDAVKNGESHKFPAFREKFEESLKTERQLKNGLA